MGIVNVTPDSFSDGGRYCGTDEAVDHAQLMIEQGADMVDIGGESTRPGASEVSADEELERVIPVIEALAKLNLLVSVDTSKPDVMEQALRVGAHMINDVRALQAPGATAVVARHRAAVCLMHMKGEPRTMQNDPGYDDVVTEIERFLAERVQMCEASGIGRSSIVIDPGFGFGKSFVHNCEVFRQLERYTRRWPMLIGVSRKRMIGDITGMPVDQRDSASAMMALMALERGARIVRAHNVPMTIQAFNIWQMISGQ